MDQQFKEIEDCFQEKGLNISKEDIQYLIDYAKERTERVEELNQELHLCRISKLSMDSIKKYTDQIKNENKDYLKVLEFYADEDNWKEKDSMDPMSDNQQNVNYDRGYKARQLLEDLK